MFRLLLIDDSIDDRVLIIHTLKREFAHFQVKEITQADSLAEAIATGDFDLVITDYQLHWNDGLTVLRQIKSHYPNCPTIMFTDSGNQEIAVEAMKAGLDDYIVKSSSHFARLPVVVRTLLGRRQVEATLQESEAKYRRILDTAAEGIWLIDLQSQTTYANQQMAKMLGYTVEEMLGRSVFDFVFEEDLIEAHQYYERIKQGIQEPFDFRFRRQDGTALWASINTNLVLDEHHQFLGMLGMLTDITDRKQTEENLQRSETRLTLALEAAQMGIWDWDLLTNQTTWSVENERLFGLAPGTFNGTYSAFIECIHPNDRELVSQAVNQALAARTGYDQEFRIVRSDGSIRWLAGKGQLLCDEADKPVRMIGITRDITEQKQAELVLQQLNNTLEQQVQDRTTQLQQAFEFEAVLRRITDKVRDSLDETQILQTAVRELAVSLSVSSCNSGLYDLEQGTATIHFEHAVSLPPSHGRVVQIAHFPEFYQLLLQGHSFQFCPVLLNLRSKPVAMLACPIFDDQGVLGDLWLIHEADHGFKHQEVRLVEQVATQCAIAIRQARLYQTAQAQVKELERLNQLKDDFLSTVSHELRTPISNIKLALKMLQLAPTSERSQHYLRILQTECDREADLINDLLDLQRLEASSDPIELEDTVNLHDWLPKIIEPFQTRAQEQQQILEVQIPPDIPPLLTNHSSLSRVLTELLNNACKYTSAGSKIILSVCFEAHTPNHRANDKVSEIHPAIGITVSNQAEIPTAELPHIFEKFYRVPNADPWKQGGTGLGLALVEKLVNQLQGRIWVKSNRGWTTFTIHLPLQQRLQLNRSFIKNPE